LLERSFTWARAHGFKKIFLCTAANIPWNGPMYARLGFKTIAESNLTDEMRTISAQEKARGLPVEDRVFMGLLL
jgi:N-acetylglutamate synthase-like GNAT family acetyltransferase